jgi:hypothetical protein
VRVPLSRKARRLASTTLRAASALKPSSLAPRLRGTRAVDLDDVERAAFVDGLGDLYGVDVADRDATLAALSAADHGIIEALVAEADLVMAGSFHVLGRRIVTDAEHPDWHVDFASGKRFPNWVPHEAVREAPYPGGYEIKTPWELSRLHDGVRLGQAYWLTGRDEYARRLSGLIEDWIAANRYGMGVNWANSMEAGIRAVNWMAALRLSRGSPALTAPFLDLVHESLLVHGRHVRARLEATPNGMRNANHYMANVSALLMIGACCRGSEADAFYEFGLAQVPAEVLSQVYEDGGHFEDSAAYHRLVLELVILALGTVTRKGDAERIPVGAWARVSEMVRYVADYTRPDGSAPAFGDADSGRVLVGYPADTPANVRDHRETIGLGATLLDDPALFACAGDALVSASWADGARVVRLRDAAAACPGPARDSRLRAATGTAVVRADDVHVTIKCGPNGQDGFGGHSHNDKLGLEVWGPGGALVVDPGTYCYTSDFEARNALRATAAHNTLQVDRLEQNAFDPVRPFGYSTDRAVEVLRWSDSGRLVQFMGQLRGSTDAACHRRHVVVDTGVGVLVVDDVLLGSRDGLAGWAATVSWHLAPNATTSAVTGGRLEAEVAGEVRELSWAPIGEVEIVARVERVPFSPQYGQLGECDVLRLSWKAVAGSSGVRTIIRTGSSDADPGPALSLADSARETLLAP